MTGSSGRNSPSTWHVCSISYQPWEGSPALPVRVVAKSCDPSGRDQFQKDFHPNLKCVWNMLEHVALQDVGSGLAQDGPKIAFESPEKAHDISFIIKERLSIQWDRFRETASFQYKVSPSRRVSFWKRRFSLWSRLHSQRTVFLIYNCVFFIEGIFLAKARLERSSQLGCFLQVAWDWALKTPNNWKRYPLAILYILWNFWKDHIQYCSHMSHFLWTPLSCSNTSGHSGGNEITSLWKV